jgi:gliding motility-associated-like protein
LRDEYGWVGLYDPSGSVVDAVYWDAFGNAANLFSAQEYQENIITHTSCSGTQTLTAARNIAGIEYLGACIPGSYLSFQRTPDGANTWQTGPITPTPHACNGPCVTAPQLNFVVQNENCDGANGSINMTITNGYSGPYSTNWLNPAGIHTNTITNLSAGTYIVQVVDAYNCFIVYDTVTIINLPGPQIQIDSIRNEMCSASDGSVYIHVIGGNPPISYLWNSNPPQQTQNLTGVHGGNFSVTITDAVGCKATIDTVLTNIPPPNIVFDQILSDTCNKSTGFIHVAVSGGHPPYAYSWNTNPSDNLNYISHLSEGNYIVSVTDSFCVSTASQYIENIPGPHADFVISPPVATIENPTFRFEDWSTGIIDNWYWDFGDFRSSIIPSPIHTYETVGIFDVMLTIRNDHGCTDSVIKQAIVIDRPTIYIPNCFSPNGDGLNDYFSVVATNITDFTLYLYDRWGELVYTSHNTGDKWNGKYNGNLIPVGIYNYVIFYKEDYGGVMLLPQTRTGLLTVLL